MSFLFKYDCGCVGFPTENNFALIVHRCDDYDGDSVTFTLRNMKNKSYTKVDDESQQRYTAEVRNLIGYGYRFKELKRILS